MTPRGRWSPRADREPGRRPRGRTPEPTGVIAAAPVADTIKQAHASASNGAQRGRSRSWSRRPSSATVSGRRRRRRSSVPARCARRSRRSRARRSAATDEAMLVEATGGRVLIHPSPAENLKVTTPLDLRLGGAAARRLWHSGGSGAGGSVRPPCSPTTTSTCAPTRTTRRRSASSPPRTSTATWPRRARRGSESWASPSTSTASPRRSSSGATRSGRQSARDDLDAYCEFVRGTPLRLGLECDFVPGAEDRTASLLEARDFDYVVGSVHFLGERAVDHDGWDVWEGGRRPRGDLAPLLRTRSPSAPAPASSTSSPTPTWSRSGAAPGRCPSATPASSMSPRSRRSSRAGSRWRSRPPGCASRLARSIRRRPSPRCASRPGAAFALSSDAHLPEQVGFGYERAIEFLDGLGRRSRSASSRGASAGSSRSGPPVSEDSDR